MDEVNAREQYWIEKLHTYCGDNNGGYNMDRGGGKKARSYVLSN